MLNGILMALVTVLMRSVAVAFNVYISNRIGAVAMGLFTLISTVYGFGITLATSGISLATTRLTAQALGDTASVTVKRIPLEKRDRVARLLRRCVLYSLFFGALATLALWFSAEAIGRDILGDARTVMPLRVLSLTLVPIAVSSVLSGYFSALRHVYKNAVTQTVGQAARIFACIAFISLLGANDVESACLAIAYGGALSEFIALATGLLLFALRAPRRMETSTDKAERNTADDSVIKNALPLAFSAYVRSALVTIEHILIPRGLEMSGASRDSSLAAYGTVGSMVFPLILFPSAITASFAGLLIPEVAESCATGDEKRIRGIISDVLEAVLIFAIGCAGILLSFSVELGATVYPEARDAGKYIMLLSPLIPVMYLDTAVDSMLKGLGEHIYTMWINIIDALLSVILVAVLLPPLGINGYIITVFFTELLNATLSITRLLVKSRVKTHALLWVGRPLLCVVAATRLTAFLTDNFFSLGNVWCHVAVSAFSYIVFMLLCGGIKLGKLIDRIKYMLKN